MKKLLMLFFAGVLISVLCVGCSEFKQDSQQPKEQELGLGEEIPGMEIKKATGTVIGSYLNGFGSLLVQVDAEYQIGKTIEPVDYKRLYTYLPENVAYRNMIQVQWNLPVEMGSKISFSFREYRSEKDFESLFAINGGAKLAFGEFEPDVPIYVITKYEILNN